MLVKLLKTVLSNTPHGVLLSQMTDCPFEVSNLRGIKVILSNIQVFLIEMYVPPVQVVEIILKLLPVLT